MFHPHVTLFSLNDTDKTRNELVNITRSVVAEVEAPISLEGAGVQIGEAFHESVYLALKSTAGLMALRTNFLKAVGAQTNTESPESPHASLYYGEGSIERNTHVVRTMMEARVINIRSDGLLDVVGLELRLDLTEIWIVDIPTDQPMDWKVVYKQALVGAKLAPSSLILQPLRLYLS